MKYKLIIPFALMMILLMVGTVMAAGTVAIVTPAGGDTIGEATYTWTATMGVEDTAGGTVYYGATAGAETTEACTNLTAVVAGGTFSCVNATSGITEGTYSWNVTSANVSGMTNSTSSTVDVDRTAPSVTVSTLKFKHEVFERVCYDCSATDSIDSSPNFTVQLLDPSANSKEALTSTSECFDPASLDNLNEWKVKCSASDNFPNTGESNTTIFVTGKDRETAILITEDAGVRGNMLPILIAALIVGLVAVLGSGAYLLIKK